MTTRTPVPLPTDIDEDDLVDRRPLLWLVLAAFILGVYLLAGRIFVLVGVGEAAVLYRPLMNGLVLNQTYGEGLQVNFPWDTLTVYDLRIKERSIDYPVLNGNGLELHVKISVRYHPRRESLAFLHQQIGPDYEQKMVIPVVEFCVRNGIGGSSVNDIYANRGDMLGIIQRNVANMLAEKFIVLDGLVFREISLPPLINTAIQEKEVQRQVLEAYEFRVRTAMREALRLQIDASGRKGYNDVVRASLDERILKWEGIAATRALSESPNAKVVVIGSGPGGLPVILGNDPTPTATPAPKAASDDFNFYALNAYLKTFDDKLHRIFVDAPAEIRSNRAMESGSGTGSPVTVSPTSSDFPYPSPSASPAAIPSHEGDEEP